jgi:hypothetical protein
MGKREPQWLWRLKLVYWMFRFGYVDQPVKAWRWSGQECWIRLYYETGYTAYAAICEDASYG